MIHGGTYGLWAIVIMALIFSVIVAQLFYWLVESPSLALKNKLSQSYYLSRIQV
jgi:peptidoglycan/LPS O-acetylase OafA/YrhL